MVLIFSSSANESPQIRNEIVQAANRGVPVIPVRIENVQPTNALAYFMGGVHWLDAITPPLEAHFKQLAEIVTALLKLNRSESNEAHGPRAAPPAQEHQRSKLPTANDYLKRGRSHYDRLEYELALADYNDAIALEPASASALASRAATLMNLGRDDAALPDLNEALRLNPQDGTAFYNRGTLFYRKQDYYRAINDFNEAIRFQPTNASAFYMRGRSHLQQSK